MDQGRLVKPADCTHHPSHPLRPAWRDWTTWGNLGLLLAAAVLPLGWLLLAARLARSRARAWRGRNL